MRESSASSLTRNNTNSIFSITTWRRLDIGNHKRIGIMYVSTCHIYMFFLSIIDRLRKEGPNELIPLLLNNRAVQWELSPACAICWVYVQNQEQLTWGRPPTTNTADPSLHNMVLIYTGSLSLPCSHLPPPLLSSPHCQHGKLYYLPFINSASLPHQVRKRW